MKTEEVIGAFFDWEEKQPGVITNCEAFQAGAAFAATLRQQAGRVDEAAVTRAIGAWFDDPSCDGADHPDFKRRMRAALEAALSAQPAERQGECEAACPEDRFEQYVAAAIARSPEPLRELGEYLTRVLDEDQFPTADRLLLQLATAHPAAPVGVPDGWSGWCTQYPNRLPKLWGAREIAELNYYPKEGQRMFQVVEVAAAPSAPQGEG